MKSKFLQNTQTQFKNELDSLSPEWTSIDHIAKWRAIHQPFKTAYIFLKDGENHEERLSYAELDKAARSIASTLLKTCNPGDRAILIYNAGLDFIKSFFGCLYAGIIAVPAYPPKINQPSNKFEAILNDSGAKIALCTEDLYPKLQSNTLLNNSSLTIMCTDRLENSEAITIANSPETIAFLQYTSGSTSNPKGVVVKHSHILANQSMIKTGFEHDENTIFVGWLPMFHDMGLIGNMLQPMYLGIPLIQISPTHFLQSPIRWLRAISKYKATTSGGPNFAYELCINKISEEQMKSLDLSSWNVAFNGAEPIQYSTLKHFSKRFKKCGFNETSFLPCFGLAETTLYVTGHRKPYYFCIKKSDYIDNKITLNPSKNDEQWLVSSGKNVPNQTLKIVNPASEQECNTQEIGEIWVAGPHITDGYWNNPEKTDENFQRKTLEPLHPNSIFLKTGDLGFLNHDKELFIIGRTKDLIIFHGKNYYPHDIEITAARACGKVNPMAVACFSVYENNTESLILAAEIDKKHMKSNQFQTICEKIQNAINHEHTVTIKEILLLRPFSLPKTSSGKLQRYLYKEMYKNKNFKSLYKWPKDNNPEHKNQEIQRDSNEIKNHILKEWQEVLCKKSIGLNDNFFYLGGTSVSFIELSEKIETKLGIQINPEEFFEYQTIEDQYRFLMIRKK